MRTNNNMNWSVDVRSLCGQNFVSGLGTILACQACVNDTVLCNCRSNCAVGIHMWNENVVSMLSVLLDSGR